MTVGTQENPAAEAPGFVKALVGEIIFEPDVLEQHADFIHIPGIAGGLGERAINMPAKDLEGVELWEMEELGRLPREERIARLADLSARVAQGASDSGVEATVSRLAFQEADSEIRKAWVAYFAASKAELYFPLLLDWLDDPDEERRLGVIGSLAWNRAARTNEVLMRTIKQDASQRVRRLALKYLVRRGSLGDWYPCDLTEIVRKADWRPVTKREYMKLVGGSFEG